MYKETQKPAAPISEKWWAWHEIKDGVYPRVVIVCAETPPTRDCAGREIHPVRINPAPLHPATRREFSASGERLYIGAASAGYAELRDYIFARTQQG